MKREIVLAALLLASAPAYADDAKPAPANVCLRHHDLDGFGARDRHSMVVNDRFGKKYLVSLAGLCDDIDFAFGVGFRPVGGANFGSCLDRGDRVVMRGGGALPGNNTCWVTKVQLYSKDMEAADKQARANKQPLPAF